MNPDMLFGYVAIGVCAALAAMAWPFRRGVLGAALNVAAGVGGAVGLASLSQALMPGSSPVHFLFATVGAMFALLLEHAVWLWVAARTHRAAR